MAIINVALSNTFNEFRISSNKVIDRVNEFESGSAAANINYLTANTIVVNTEVLSNVFSTSSNTANVTISTNGGENTSFITIESGDNGNVAIVANGSGTLFLHAANTVVGNGAIDSTLTSNGAYDLIINTNSGTNSGFIRLYDGVNGNIVIQPDGTGDLQVNADTVRIGDNNVDAILTTQGTGDLILSTNSGSNSGTVRIYDGAAGNIAIEPNGAGDIHLIADTTRLGSSGEDVILTTNGTGDVTINTNAGTNSGSIKIFDGVNGNVDITTNGTGKTNVKNIVTGNVITSTIASGSAPIAVTSNTVVTNLNADEIDGKHVATLAAAGGILYASATNEISGSSAGTLGQAVISGGASAPTYQTVASGNGSSTIIARDASGSFSANLIAANGAFLSSLNASNIATGTIANARTTGVSTNTPNTLVLRDANGSFSANSISVTTIGATNFAGSGAQLSSLNASNITTGTIANARTTGVSTNTPNTLVLRDANGSFGANVASVINLNASADISAVNVTVTNIIGNGSQLTNLNASNLATGTVPNARTSGASGNGASTLVLRDANGDFAGRTITTTNIIGNGSQLTNLNASNIATGTVPNARTSASSANSGNSLVLRDQNGSFAANLITANGAFLSDLNASNLSIGTIPNSATTANTSNSASTLVLRDANGDFSSRRITSTIATGTSPFVVASTTAVTNLNSDKVDGKDIGTLSAAGGIVYASSTSSLAGTGAGTAGQAVISGGAGAPTFQTVASANGASTIIARDANGSFSANVITTNILIASGVGGDGSQLTNLNASNIATGTIANARTTGASANGASTLVLRDANGDFSSRRITSTIATGTSPLAVTSTTVVANLNADQVDGKNVGTLSAAGGIVYASSTSALAGTAAGTAGQAVISGGAGVPTFQTVASSNGASTIVSRNALGSFAANVVTAELAGNAATATKLATARTIFLSGDVAGSATFDGSGNTTISSTIQTNSVALGTDTTGNYVANVTSGSGIVVSGTAGEGWTANVAHADTSTQASVNNSNGTVIQDITLDGFGHITAIGSVNLDDRYYTESEIDTNFANLNNLSSANTANTIVLRTEHGSFGANGALISDLNASNIATGTIVNARTTGNSSNGANTLVLRDANGDFSSRRITSTIATGTSPFAVSSTTVVTNLNADQVDGIQGASLLRSDATDAYTSGTLTFNSGTTLTAANGATVNFSNVVGTAPFAVTSNTLVTNLNADLLDGQQGTYYLDWTNVTNKPDPVITVTLTGDVAGSANTTLTDLANGTVSVATTIQANSVALGTDTTGNYVAGITAGTSITVSGSGSENATVTVNHADTSTLTGAQGGNGIAGFTIDGLGHITAVTSATYLTSESDTLQTVTGRGATTNQAISITNTTASTSTTTGALKVSGGVGINGALNALTKSFVIKHPTKDNMLLRHGSLEGPEFGVYVRGRTQTGEIQLPDYWTGLVDESTITVNLTPIGSHQMLYVYKIENNCVYVHNVALGPIDCFFTVYGERKDIDKIIVETVAGV